MVLFSTTFTRLKFSVLFCAGLIILFSFDACKPKPKPVIKHVKAKVPVSFKSIIGIPFTEARRTFESGLAFEEHGFYQPPNWKFTFLSEDSISIYSPTKKAFVINPVILDHDSVVNLAWAWLRVVKLSKDSLIFQVLKVQNKTISHDHPYVFMKLYADSYITDSLHTSAFALQKPTSRDTTFIKHLIDLTKDHPEKAFAATNPVMFISKSPKLMVKKREVKPDMATGTVAEEAYFSPEYDINIHHAYDDFSYSFAATVDEKGQIIFIRSIDQSYGDPEFDKYMVRNIKAIISGYLKYYLQVIPGRTLNIPHSSMIVLNVNGTKDK